MHSVPAWGVGEHVTLTNRLGGALNALIAVTVASAVCFAVTISVSSSCILSVTLEVLVTGADLVVVTVTDAVDGTVADVVAMGTAILELVCQTEGTSQPLIMH